MNNVKNSPILSTKNLVAHYGDFQALYGINMEITSEEIVAIIGANGAGKSTLMRSICGLLKNEKDQIKYGSKPIGALRADQVAHLGIAIVPEGRQLFESLSVKENLLIGGQTKRNGPWSLEKIYGLFPILEERRNYPATALSGGQQQMVAIGRALMANPDLLLLDEISLGLAPVIIKTIYEALPKIVAQGMSAVIVEQDVSRALSVSSRFYCLQEGRVSLEGKSGSQSRESISQAYFGV